MNTAAIRPSVFSFQFSVFRPPPTAFRPPPTAYRLPPSALRPGFSLLEVVVATAILLASAILLSELAAVGRQHASSAEDLAAAQRICQSTLNEILAGAAPLAPIDKEPLGNEPGWVYSVEIEPLETPFAQPGLAVLRVTVTEDVEPPRRAAQFTLSRWIRDPGLPDETGREGGQMAEGGGRTADGGSEPVGLPRVRGIGGGPRP
jgi:prepilin-type N-terminal cleavage/methylation domain-containing protein